MNFWKNLKKPFTVLAPMEDVTDVVFRSIVAECGRPDVFFTEFTSAEGMFSPGRDKVTQRLEKNDSESPIVAQIWGKTPDAYFKAAQDIVDRGFDGVDINMGCPVKKIVKQGACSALIQNPTLASEVIHATIEGVAGNIPVSVKTRMGFSVKKTEEWSEFLLKHDIQALTMHPRLAKDDSKYPAEWDEVGKVVQLRNALKKDTVIIGNGDIEFLDQVKQMHESYGVDGVMVGRGIFKDPFVFNTNKSIHDLSFDEKLDLLLRHAELFHKTWGRSKNFSILRRFFKIYISGVENASDIRMKFMETEGVEDVMELVKQLRGDAVMR